MAVRRWVICSGKGFAGKWGAVKSIYSAAIWETKKDALTEIEDGETAVPVTVTIRLASKPRRGK